MNEQQPNDEQPEHPALDMWTTSLRIREGKEDPSRLSQADFSFGGTTLNMENIAPHFVFVGSSGAGKTILQKGLMQSVLIDQQQSGNLNYRAVIYDPKRELVPWLVKAGVNESNIIITHPFDKRSSAWDLAKDFVEPAQIAQLAELIVPDESLQKRDAVFFENAARIILQDVVYGLIHKIGDEWTLRDIVNACDSPESIFRVLSVTDTGKATMETYFPNSTEGQMSSSVFATLNNHIRPFKTLAALWQRAETKFSLTKWHNGAGILLLGADPRRELTLQKLNRLFMQRVSQLALGRTEERPVDQTWFFMDEIREAGKLRGLRRLLTEGRSKGVRVAIGFQDMDGMTSIYGQYEAPEIVGLCANRVVLHLDNPKTARWASSVFGEAEMIIDSESQSESETLGRESRSRTTQRGVSSKIGTRVNALPIQFQDLPLASLEPNKGVKGWYSVPGKRNEFAVSVDACRQMLLLDEPDIEDVPAYLERPVTDQEPEPLTEAEKARFPDVPKDESSPSDNGDSGIDFGGLFD